jgi:hypothetical protein
MAEVDIGGMTLYALNAVPIQKGSDALTDDANVEGGGFDPRKRRLCPDGACIGLIGADGRCKVCGLADPGGARGTGGGLDAAARRAPPADEDADDADDAGAGDDDEARAPEARAAPSGAAFDPKRRLCPDGACIGVIGADGRCKVCGRHENS